LIVEQQVAGEAAMSAKKFRAELVDMRRTSGYERTRSISGGPLLCVSIELTTFAIDDQAPPNNKRLLFNDLSVIELCRAKQ
jgi:hypothetical protein